MKSLLEQKLKQNLSLNQKMKLSINVLAMSIENLNSYIKNEIAETKGVEIKFFSTQKNYYRDDDYSEIQNISQEKNFFEYLEEQINFMQLTRKQREDCIFIINNLNEKGYLSLSKNEVSKILKLNKSEMEEIFGIIYNLEPYGLGAINLEECLKIQLKQKNIIDEKLYNLIDKYLVLIAEKQFDLIKSKLEINDRELEEYISEIKKLNPIPSRGYNTGKIRNIVPEIIVKKKDGKLRTEINEKIIPKISIKDDEVEDKNFYTKINNLVEAIEKRYNTLLRISEFLVKRQKNFFETEGEDISTLKIIDVAKELDFSPSTISRAIKEKYMSTDFGIVPLKRLICISSETVLEKNYIENYIENENKEKPYSDQELRAMLIKEGFDIARRTVSKYRKELGYKSSFYRKV